MSEEMQMPRSTGSLNDPEPAPTGIGVPVWPLVISDLHLALLGGGSQRRDSRTDLIISLMIDDMSERDLMGRAKYGTALMTNNGRSALRDAYQEALDLAVYLRQAVREGDEGVQPAYRDALSMVTMLRTMIHVRFGK